MKCVYMCGLALAAACNNAQVAELIGAEARFQLAPLRQVPSADAFCQGYVAARPAGGPPRGCGPIGPVYAHVRPPFRRVYALRYGERGAIHDPDALREAALVIETSRGAFVRTDVARDPDHDVDLSITAADVVAGRLLIRYAHAQGNQETELLEAAIACSAPAGTVVCTGELPTWYRKTWEAAPTTDPNGLAPPKDLPSPIERRATVELDPNGAVVVTPDPASAAWYGELAGRHDLPPSAPALPEPLR